MHKRCPVVCAVLAAEGLLDAQTVAIDATTLEANAAMRSIRRRDDGRKYEEYLRDLATAEGIENPTREQIARMDRRRKKKASNQEWMSPSDPDARITKMKDGRTHLAHKAEHAVDLSSGALVAVTLQGADQGDTTTVHETLAEAQIHAQLIHQRGVEEVVADKGYHSGAALVALHQESVRTYIPEPERGRDTGGAGRRNSRGCMPTGGGCKAGGGKSCRESGRSWWNAASRTCTRRAGCGERICETQTTS